MVRSVHRRPRTPPVHFLPICPVATRDEESSPVATRSAPHKVPARKDRCKRPAAYRRRPSLPEGKILGVRAQKQMDLSVTIFFDAFAFSCDIPRTPHRRAPEVPPHGSGSRTAPRTNSTTSSLGSSVVGISMYSAPSTPTSTSGALSLSLTTTAVNNTLHCTLHLSKPQTVHT